MKRREFFGVLGGTAAWPVVARAQQQRVPVIGFLRVGTPPPSFIDPLRAGLKDLGYIDGQNFRFVFEIANEVAELPRLAAGLATSVDVLVASGTPAVIPATPPRQPPSSLLPRLIQSRLGWSQPGAAGRQRHRLQRGLLRLDRKTAGASQGTASLAQSRRAALAAGQPGSFAVRPPDTDGRTNSAR